jgi:8-amino-7-oxononanoate synthase
MMWNEMIALGVYVNMARPPATPTGVYLLRCSLCAEHTSAQIETVLGRFAEAGRKVGAIS